jgi:hypothetical protein
MSSKAIDYPTMFGESIFYASIQFAVGSVEMSSKFSVVNFCKDQEILDNAVEALRNYMMIALGWSCATALVLYSKYGWRGIVSGIVFNAGIVAWIYFSYIQSFNRAAEKYNLVVPSVFF